MIDRIFDIIETYGYPIFVAVLILTVVGLSLLPHGTSRALKQLIGG